MPNPRGIFIVIEGSDGSGKKTQFELLHDRLEKAGYEVAVFDFPRYSKPSSYFVKRYLNGDYGPASSINPYTASLFFALDRFEAAPKIKQALAEGKVVLSNRYVGSNMAHQGSSFAEAIDKRSFFVWEDSIEYQLLGLPRPDVNIFLRVPAELSFELMKQRAKRDYTEKTHDELEGDIEHLKRTVQTYDLLCQLFPKDFSPIDCAPEGDLLSIEAISRLVWAQVGPLLPPAAATPAVVEEPPAAPEPAQNVSQLSWQIPSISLLALNELRLKGVKVTAGQPWRGSYAYHTPAGLDKRSAHKYSQAMDKIVQLHKAAFVKLRKHLSSKAEADYWLRPTVPAAATVSAEVPVSREDAIDLLAKLRTSQNKEVLKLASDLTTLIEDNWPQVVKDALVDDSGRPEAIGAIIQKLSQDLLPQPLGLTPADNKLLAAMPKNEFDLIADSLYPYSSLSREEIQAEVGRWDYAKKASTLTKTLARSGALALAKYRFDLLTSQLILGQVLEGSNGADYTCQPVTPRYGYDVPEIIDTAGIDVEYLDIFDLSLELYSSLQSAGAKEPEYATLLGHQARWQVTLSAADINKLAESGNKDSRLQALADSLREKQSEVHPIVTSLGEKPVVKKPVAKRTARPKKSLN
jgi:dTMP kinase